MKQKVLAVGLVLVVVCVTVFVVQGVSQPPDGSSNPFPQSSPATPSYSVPSQSPTASWSTPPKSPTIAPPNQERTFEQLVEALKGVRARQKELKTQESDLLAKMAEKVEQKRTDLHKSEETLQQLRGEPSHRPPVATGGGFANPTHP